MTFLRIAHDTLMSSGMERYGKTATSVELIKRINGKNIQNRGSLGYQHFVILVDAIIATTNNVNIIRTNTGKRYVCVAAEIELRHRGAYVSFFLLPSNFFILVSQERRSLFLCLSLSPSRWNVETDLETIKKREDKKKAEKKQK